MTLVLNEEQLMLKDAAQNFLQDRAPVGLLRELRDAGNEEGFLRCEPGCYIVDVQILRY